MKRVKWLGIIILSCLTLFACEKEVPLENEVPLESKGDDIPIKVNPQEVENKTMSIEEFGQEVVGILNDGYDTEHCEYAIDQDTKIILFSADISNLGDLDGIRVELENDPTLISSWDEVIDNFVDLAQETRNTMDRVGFSEWNLVMTFGEYEKNTILVATTNGGLTYDYFTEYVKALENQANEQEAVEKTTIELNQPITVKYFGEDSFELKILSVEYTDKRNQFSDKEVSSVAIITVEGVNISDKTQYLSDNYFNFYGEGGEKLGTYPVRGQYPIIQELNAGRKGTISFAIGISNGSKLEMEVVNIGGNSDPIGSIFFDNEN